MTRHTLRSSVSGNLLPYRDHPAVDDSTKPTDHDTDLLAGQKRSAPDNPSLAAEKITHEVKRQRHDSDPDPSHDCRVRGGPPSASQSPRLVPDRTRSHSPNLSFVEAAATMLSKAEETGGNRAVKLVRGLPTSPLPPRSLSRPTSRHSSEPGAVPRSLTARSNPSSQQMLDSISLTEFLQADERPIFVVDLQDNDQNEGVHIVFANHTLRARSGLFDCIQGKVEDAALLLDLGTPFADFRTWLLNQHDTQDISSSFPFAGVIWRVNTIRQRLRILIGHADALSGHTEMRPRLQKFHGLASSVSQRSSRKKTPDEPGYFDIQPPSARSNAATNMELLMQSSRPDESPHSVDILSAEHSHGDSAMSDLLQGPGSPYYEAKPQQSRTLIPVRSNAENFHPMSASYLNNKGFFDWTRLPMSPSLPEHIKFARSFDWAATSLGPIEEWSADLRGMCNLIMASPHPSAMYWGSDHVAIYNEPYIMLAGNKHPSLLGSRYRDAWAEIWDALEDVFQVAMTTAQATMKDDDCLFMMRNGFLEETYFSWSIIPLIGDDGSVVGLYNPAFEKTRRKIAERRMLTLREIGERTGTAREVSEFWSLLLEGFQYNEYDAPMVIIYSLSDNEDNDNASSASSTAAALKQCRLEASVGVSPGHPCAPEVIDLKHDTKGFSHAFKLAITAEKPIVLSIDDGSLDPALIENVQWRGFGDPSRVVVVSPVRPTTGESTLGFLVLATNPRRPYDEDYDLFIQLLSRQLATSVASVVLFEEEIKKGERAAKMAAQDRIELSNQLAARTQEAVESESKFTRMAELAPVGMYIGDELGRITFANDAWHSISSYPRDQTIENRWFSYVLDEDRAKTWGSWQNMLQNKCPVSIEFRFKTPWKDRFGNTNSTWVLASASPEKDDDGNITRLFGSVTDISSQKFAEELQRKRMEEAVEMKRQQERYIDTTSHEMRNPLSAILQSADAITASLTELRALSQLTNTQVEMVDAIIESSQTITLCAQHQKRIVDDVLTLSKLDSAMLLVTPIDIQPHSIARRAVKMFEGELQTADIELDVRVDKSYQSLGVDWVRLDPTRLSQVLINLMTNAIKFTTTQDKRVIRMHLAASKDKPSQEDKWKLTYIPSQAPKDKDVTAAPEWGLGEPIYIHFAVQDTGRGLDENEKKQLFQRFSQANPRTHVTYGGSGLGLFISRMLVELQGGEIGVASEAGKGSTFAFYVKGRRSQAPQNGSGDDVDSYQSRKGSKGASKLAKLKTSLPLIGSPPITSPVTSAAQIEKAKLDATGLRVLIVEDNLINQRVLAAQLRKIGCEVLVANHGGEAIEQIKNSTFYRNHEGEGVVIDVVLMDLEMPVMDGQTCARELRKMQLSGELVRHIPVIAVTANAREEQIRNTLDAGIDDVVSKPFRIPELVPKMRDNIARFVDQNKAPERVPTPMVVEQDD